MKVLIQGLCLTASLCGIIVPLSQPFSPEQTALAATKAPAKASGLQRLFRRSMEAYEAKAFEDAIDLLTQLLQNEPDYLPAKIQLARSLYQLKRFPEAFKLFQQIEDIGILEPDPSYEYGQSAFQSNDYTLALKAFRNVPNGHPMFDLAGYFGGIAAFKLGDYQTATELFAQVVVLPSKLLKSQKLYQKETERLINQKQKQELANTQAQISNPAQRPAGSGEDAVEVKPLHHLKVRRELRLEPRLSSQAHQTVDNRSSDHKIYRGLLELDYGVERSRNSPRTSHWALQTRLRAQALEGTSAQELINPDIQTEQDQFVIEKAPPRSLFSFEPTAAIEWPISLGTSLGLVAGTRGILLGDPKAKSAAIPQLSLFLAQKNSRLETLLNLSFYGMILDNQAIYSNGRQLGRIDFQLLNHFQFVLQGELSEFAYNSNQTDGPNWEGRILTELIYDNEQAFLARLGFFYQVSEGQRFHGLPQAPILEFESTGFGTSLTSELGLFRYFNLGIEAQMVQRMVADLSPLNIDTQAALTNAHPSFVTSFAVYFNISTGL